MVLMMEIRQILETDEKQIISSQILNALPQWFGIPESVQEYVRSSSGMPFWAAFESERPIGFLARKKTGDAAAEIYVMGVLPEYHRKGVGRELYAALENDARQHGIRYLQVKTVKMGCYPFYDKTNRFYQSMGFSELECFPQLWDVWNPCQIYVMAI